LIVRRREHHRGGRLAVNIAGAALLISGLLVSACSSDASSDLSPDSTDVTGTAGAEPIDSVPTPSVTTASGRQPEGFTTITARITETGGEVCEVCVWLADTPEERARGLMGVTDLGDGVGMVFSFDEPLVGSFYMFQTPTPLSIAWFGDDGGLVGSADMAPCLDTPAGECPLYSPGVAYDLALEVFDGGLDDLGIGPGSRLELVDGTEAERCPVGSDASG
jgi:uncharacterized membrane protein (UPF0127 family)